MDRIHTIASRPFWAFLLVAACFAVGAFAQENPFAPQKPPPLPPGMTGADVNDPRAKLSPGMFYAGEAASGLRHVTLLKKPDAFQLASDPEDPKVNRGVSIIAGDPKNVPAPMKLVLAGLAFANSDLAFQGNR